MGLERQYGTLCVMCVRTSANRMIFPSFCKNRRAFWFRHLLYCLLCIDAKTSGATKVTSVSLISALLLFSLKIQIHFNHLLQWDLNFYQVQKNYKFLQKQMWTTIKQVFYSMQRLLKMPQRTKELLYIVLLEWQLMNKLFSHKNSSHFPLVIYQQLVLVTVADISTTVSQKCSFWFGNVNVV